ncbi:MAG: hypothetical protein PSY14_06520 [bacterium]|nr:hypothetical protein [bacterium]
MVELYTASKITAAGCQLDTATELLLSSRDLLSAAVLIHSAWSVTKDLLAHKKTESSRSWMAELFPQLTEIEIWRKLDEVWTFSKHANKDPDAVIQFSGGYVEAVLFLAIYDFSQISPVKSKTMDIYELWFIAKNANLFSGHEVFIQASKLFPDLASLSYKQQAIAGFKLISSVS